MVSGGTSISLSPRGSGRRESQGRQQAELRAAEGGGLRTAEDGEWRHLHLSVTERQRTAGGAQGGGGGERSLGRQAKLRITRMASGGRGEAAQPWRRWESEKAEEEPLRHSPPIAASSLLLASRAPPPRRFGRARERGEGENMTGESHRFF